MSLPEPTTATTASRPADGAATPPAARTAARRRTFALLGSELALVFRRRRTWAMKERIRENAASVNYVFTVFSHLSLLRHFRD